MFHIPAHKNVLNPPSQVAIADPVEANAFRNASSLGIDRVIALADALADRSGSDLPDWPYWKNYHFRPMAAAARV
jgi:hypothetical protein